MYYYYDYFYRQQNAANQIYNAFRQEHASLIHELETAGMEQEMITYIIWTVIQFTLAHANQFNGTINNRTNNIYENMIQQIQWLTYLFRAYRLSANQMRRVLRTIIRFSLQGSTTPM
jgi:hypothetical protein